MQHTYIDEILDDTATGQVENMLGRLLDEQDMLTAAVEARQAIHRGL